MRSGRWIIHNYQIVTTVFFFFKQYWNKNVHPGVLCLTYILISLNPTLTKGYVCTPYLRVNAAGGLLNTEEELFMSDVGILLYAVVILTDWFHRICRVRPAEEGYICTPYLAVGPTGGLRMQHRRETPLEGYICTPYLARYHTSGLRNTKVKLLRSSCVLTPRQWTLRVDSAA